MIAIFGRLLRQDEGQDLVEYALLVAFVGFACVGAWVLIERALGEGYAAMDANEQGLARETPDPW